jgi:hypothetical protein
MKNIFNYTKTGLLFILLCSTVSCKKSFLEVTPKGKLIAEKTSDYDLLLNNTDLTNADGNPQIVMGDEMAAVDPLFTSSVLRTQRLFRWDDVIYEPDQDATELTAPMRAIYTYNKIVNEVMSSTDGTEQQKKIVAG